MVVNPAAAPVPTPVVRLKNMEAEDFKLDGARGILKELMEEGGGGGGGA
jgi:hypothetical protein